MSGMAKQLKNGPFPASSRLFSSFRAVRLLKNLGASGIRTWIVGAVDVNADHPPNLAKQFPYLLHARLVMDTIAKLMQRQVKFVSFFFEVLLSSVLDGFNQI